jgi:hypothetical protein
MRIKACAGSQFKCFPRLIQNPNTRERRVQMVDHCLRTSLKHFIQLTPTVKSVAEICSQKCQFCLLRNCLQHGLILSRRMRRHGDRKASPVTLTASRFAFRARGKVSSASNATGKGFPAGKCQAAVPAFADWNWLFRRALFSSRTTFLAEQRRSNVRRLDLRRITLLTTK